MTPHNPETPMTTEPDLAAALQRSIDQARTPTPPGDTRQQAAQAMEELLTFAYGIADEFPGSSERMGLLLDTVRAALASSSPALPEPPAPIRDGDLLQWTVDTVGGARVIQSRSGATRLWVNGAKHTPAEARLLASTLLAAADVAEEQQP